MKLRFFVVLATSIICFLLINIQSVFAQGFIPFERSSGFNVSPPSSPASSNSGTLFGLQRATAQSTCPNCGAPLWGGPGTPCGNCDHSTEGKLPVGGGYWVLVGLAMVYGIFCRHNHHRVKRSKILRFQFQ